MEIWSIFYSSHIFQSLKNHLFVSWECFLSSCNQKTSRYIEHKHTHSHTCSGSRDVCCREKGCDVDIWHGYGEILCLKGKNKTINILAVSYGLNCHTSISNTPLSLSSPLSPFTIILLQFSLPFHLSR